MSQCAILDVIQDAVRDAVNDTRESVVTDPNTGDPVVVDWLGGEGTYEDAAGNTHCVRIEVKLVKEPK